MEEVRNKVTIINEGRKLIGAVLGLEADIHPLCRQVWHLVEELQQLERKGFAETCAYFSMGRKCSVRYVIKIAEQGKYPTFESFMAAKKCEVVAKSKKSEKEVAKERTRAAATATRTVEVAKTITDTLDVDAVDGSGDAKDQEIARLRARVAELEAENRELRLALSASTLGLFDANVDDALLPSELEV